MDWAGEVRKLFERTFAIAEALNKIEAVDDAVSLSAISLSLASESGAQPATAAALAAVGRAGGVG